MKQLFTEQSVERIFEKIKADAFRALSNGQLNQSAHYIETAARWAYQFNFKYTDSDLEDCMKSIAAKMSDEVDDYVGEADKVVFLCNRIADDVELAQQYARALSKRQIPYLMIVINRTPPNGYQNIMNELRQDAYATVEFVDDKQDLVGTALEIVEKVRAYRPGKILNHAWPWDVRIWLAIAKLRDLPCYNICFNDHSFWLGASLLDYNIEFRSYGAQIAIEKRGLKPEQLYHLPYYPIMPKDVPFQGFPKETLGKTLIFTGGNYYKMRSRDGRYFKNIDRILDENPKAVFLLATGNSVDIKENIDKLKNRDRVFFIGYRKDIYEVFKHCDIYYGTYPMGGGLMSQYAATLSKPILALHNPKLGLEESEGVICYNARVHFACYSDWELCDYAKRLCNDIEFRKKEGSTLNQAVISEAQFDDKLSRILSSDAPTDTFESLHLDYEGITVGYCDYFNAFPMTSIVTLRSIYHERIWLKYPRFILPSIKRVLQKTVLKIFK